MIGLYWSPKYRHWVWKYSPATYENRISVTNTHTGSGWLAGLVTIQQSGHWSYNSQNITHHYICQSLEGEI